MSSSKLVLFTRFPESKRNVKTALEELAKKRKMSANQLSVMILERYISRELQLEKHFSSDNTPLQKDYRPI